MRLIHTLGQRLAGRPDSEHQQAIVRLVLGTCLTAYFLPIAIEAENTKFLQAMASYLVAIFSIPAWILIDPSINKARRIVGIITDMIALGAAMILIGDKGIGIFVLYLWVTAGNGFRYGQKYLFIALVLGIISLLIVSQSAEPFIQNKTLGIELIIGYALFTLYINSLVRKLYAAIEAATAASIAKQSFLSTMSHELRTPLHAVAGMADLLKLELTGRRKELDMLGSIETAVNHMLSMVNDILDFAKIEAGKIEVVKAEFLLDQLAVAMAKLYRAQAIQKNLIFKTYLSPDLPQAIIGDEKRIRQILTNLLSNALKFTHEGAVSLSVEPAIDDVGRACIKWTAKDTGIGMTKESMAKMFDSFTQADASTSRKYGGTGLGTTIARELVLAMQGKIGVESEEGKGTNIWFTLPYESVYAPANKVMSHPDVPLLTMVPEFRQDILDYIQSTHPFVYASKEQTEREISKAHSWTIGIVVYGVKGKLPPSGYLALQRGVNTVIFDDQAQEYEVSIYKELGAICVCRSMEQLGRAISILQLWAGLFTDDVELVLPGVVGKRVLIADDNRTNLQILASILKLHQHTVTEASNGDDVIDLAQKNEYDLFIFDMNMPGMNGLELTRAIREKGIANSNKPIAILTADATKETSVLAMDSGANCFITKPINKIKLLQKISELLSGSNAKTDADQTPSAIPVVLNTSSFEDLMEDNPVSNFITTLIAQFLEDADKELKCLAEALRKKDCDQWCDSAHRMRGAAMNLGLERLAHALDLSGKLPAEHFEDKSVQMMAYIQTELSIARGALAEFSPIVDLRNKF